MKKPRFTEAQIIKVLKEVEGGRQVKEVCREYGISDATYYNLGYPENDSASITYGWVAKNSIHGDTAGTKHERSKSPYI